MKGYADLHKLSENQRIKLIVERVLAHREVVGVIVDDEPGKPERYRRKILERAPGLKIEEFKGPAPGVVSLKVYPPAEPARN